jgi:hypothetical protein
MNKNNKPICKVDIAGTKRWCLNGKLHREDGPAIEYADGDKEWWLNGVRHREDGLAVEYNNGHKGWWFNGKPHREDGPTIEWADDTKSWYLNGKHYNKQDYYRELVKRCLCTEQEAFVELL